MTENFKYTIVCGHYGCGKTNFAVNLAAQARLRGESVTLVDLDIVNPYFRSSDYKDILDDLGVELIAPSYAHSNVDLPALPAQMYSIFSSDKDRIIIDAGGDDQGATALGRFSKRFLETGQYQMIYVINKYRPLSSESDDALNLLNEIEIASHLKASAIFNNSHLMEFTNEDTILNSLDFAEEISRKSGLPIIGTAADKNSYEKLSGKCKNLYPVEIYVNPPWGMV